MCIGEYPHTELHVNPYAELYLLFGLVVFVAGSRKSLQLLSYADFRQRWAAQN